MREACIGSWQFANRKIYCMCIWWVEYIDTSMYLLYLYFYWYISTFSYSFSWPVKALKIRFKVQMKVVLLSGLCLIPFLAAPYFTLTTTHCCISIILSPTTTASDRLSLFFVNPPHTYICTQIRAYTLTHLCAKKQKKMSPRAVRHRHNKT